MNLWKTAVLGTVLMVSAAAAAAFAPVASGQEESPRIERRAVEIFGGGGRIGVSIRDVGEGDAKAAKGATAGVLVEDVAADGPAAKAGMRKGDIIVEFDGERVRSARQLTRLVQETPAGRSVPAVLLRDGQRTTVTVTPEESNRFSFERLHDLEDMARGFALRVPPVPPAPHAPGAPNPPDAPPPPPTVFRFDELLGRNQLGVTLQSLAPQLAEYFGVKEGVLVTSVSDSSVAAAAGLKAGDVITSFNGASVNDPGDLRRQVQQLKDGDDFTVVVTRDHKSVTLKGKADWPERRRPATRTRV